MTAGSSQPEQFEFLFYGTLQKQHQQIYYGTPSIYFNSFIVTCQFWLSGSYLGACAVLAQWICLGALLYLFMPRRLQEHERT